MARIIGCYASTIRRVAGVWLFEGFVQAPLSAGDSIRFRKRKYKIDSKLSIQVTFNAADQFEARDAGNHITGLLDLLASEMECEFQIRATPEINRLLALTRLAIRSLDHTLSAESPGLDEAEELLQELASFMAGLGDKSQGDVIARSRMRAVQLD